MNNYKAKTIEKKEMKEFLVNHDGKWTLQLLDSDTEENSFRVAVPSGSNYAHANDLGLCFTEVRLGFNHPLLVWQRSETEYLMQDKPDIKYMNGCATGKTESLNNTYAEIEQVRQAQRTAEQINHAAMHHIIERGKTYDSEAGERSASKTAQAFNAVTGHNISEAEVFLLLQILKDVRQWSKDDYHRDSAEDSISYAVLKTEALEREVKPLLP